MELTNPHVVRVIQEERLREAECARQVAAGRLDPGRQQARSIRADGRRSSGSGWLTAWARRQTIFDSLFPQ